MLRGILSPGEMRGRGVDLGEETKLVLMGPGGEAELFSL